MSACLVHTLFYNMAKFMRVYESNCDGGRYGNTTEEEGVFTMILLAYAPCVCDNNVKERAMKKKIVLTAILVVIVCVLAGSTCFAATETNVKPVDNMGDIFFYILAAILVVAVIAICVIFRYSKKFVVKERERLIEQKKEYVPAKEIRVTDTPPEEKQSKSPAKKNNE